MSEEYRGGWHYLPASALLFHVSDMISVGSGDGQTVDVRYAYVMPGLCDAHVHVTAISANLHDLLNLPPSLVTARATVVLHDMLMRGFTTVRDAGGCDWGLAKVS